MSLAIVFLALFVSSASADRVVSLRSGTVTLPARGRRMATLADQPQHAQWLVHLNELRGQSLLTKYLPDREFRYIPQNSFIVYASRDEIAALQNAPDPEQFLHSVIILDADLKYVADDFSESQRLSDPVVLHISAGWHGAHPTFAAATAAGLYGIQESDMPNELTAKGPRSKILKIVRALAEEPSVSWVAPEASVQILVPPNPTSNLEAVKPFGMTSSYALQTDEATRGRPIWDAGIYGQNQKIHVGDTGLDYKSCFFEDPDSAQSIRFQSVVASVLDGTVTYQNQSLTNIGNGNFADTSDPGDNFLHRKVQSIITGFPSSPNAFPQDVLDYITGHGTHVAGCCCGFPKGAYSDSAIKTCFTGTSTSCSSVDSTYLISKYTASGGVTNPATFGGNGFAIGMAPAAKVVFQDLMNSIDPNNAGYGALQLPSLFARDYLWPVYTKGVRISSNSFGNPAYDNTGTYQQRPYDDRSQRVDSFVFDHPDMLVVVAAGNEGSKNTDKTIASPANAKNTISVGATMHLSASVSVTEFSSKGPTIDGRIKPDLVAPGYFVLASKSAGPSSTSAKTMTQVTCNSDTMSGTSMATPTVAGVVAQVRQYLEEGYYPYGDPSVTGSVKLNPPSAALVKAYLIAGAQLVDQSASTYPGPSTIEGFGEITLANNLLFKHADTAAKRAAMPTRSVWYIEDEFKSSALNPFTYCFRVGASTQRLKFTLVWSDQPSTPSASTNLVVDLDLLVSNSKFQTIIGNHGTKADTLNNAEIVEFTQPSAGDYKVTVSLKGNALVNGKNQKFALVVVGPLVWTGTDSKTLQSSGLCPSGCPNNCSMAATSAAAVTNTQACNAATQVCTCMALTTGSDCSQKKLGTQGSYTCPSSASDTSVCNGHGCKNSAGTCECYQDLVNGYWDPSDNCASCLKDGTGKTLFGPTTSCVFDLGSCSGAFGELTSAGECACYNETFRGSTGTFKGAWMGTGCNKCLKTSTEEWSAPSSGCLCKSGTCDGHGTCPEKGYCQCHDTDALGHWGGVNDQIDAGDATSTVTCQYCKTGWGGPGCKCSLATDGTICGGHGTCTVDGCVCDNDIMLTKVSATNYELVLSNYQEASVTHGTGQVSPLRSSAYLRTKGGYWRCSAGGSATCVGSCSVCASGWSTEAAGCICQNSCSGHASAKCNARTGCSCPADSTTAAGIAAGLWGSNVTAKASDGSTQIAKVNCAVCADGWIGFGGKTDQFCNCISTPKADGSGTTECNGRGQCTQGGCQCFSGVDTRPGVTDNRTGFYAGSLCNDCDGGYRGPLITSAAGLGRFGCLCYDWGGAAADMTPAGCSDKTCKVTAECGGHGKCSFDGCACFQDAANGFWASPSVNNKTVCTKCAQGYDGDGCKCKIGCSGHGVCGPSGCICSSLASAGHWMPSSCINDPASCKVGGSYVGPDCSVCAQGYSPEGSCTCNQLEGCVSVADLTLPKLEPMSIGIQSTAGNDIVGLSYTANTFSGTLQSHTGVTLTFNTIKAGDPLFDPTLEGKVYMGSTFKISLDANKTGGRLAGRDAVAAATAKQAVYCPAGSIMFPSGNAITLTITSDLARADAAAGGKLGTEWAGATSKAYIFWNNTWTSVEELTCADGISVQPATQKGGSTEWTAHVQLCCLPATSPISIRPAVSYSARIALFSDQKVKSLWESTAFTLGNTAVPLAAVAIVILVVLVCCVLCCCVCFIFLIFRIRRARKQRFAKEQVVRYLTERKAQQGKTLRRRLKLAPGEKFTPNIAAERFLRASARSRELLRQLADPGSFRITSGPDTSPLVGTPADYLEAMTRINQKRLDRTLEFAPEEQYLVKCGRQIRSMFGPDQRLRPGCLPGPQWQALAMQMEILARQGQ